MMVSERCNDDSFGEKRKSRAQRPTLVTPYLATHDIDRDLYELDDTNRLKRQACEGVLYLYFNEGHTIWEECGEVRKVKKAIRHQRSRGAVKNLKTLHQPQPQSQPCNKHVSYSVHGRDFSATPLTSKSFARCRDMNSTMSATVKKMKQTFKKAVNYDSDICKLVDRRDIGNKATLATSLVIAFFNHRGLNNKPLNLGKDFDVVVTVDDNTNTNNMYKRKLLTDARDDAVQKSMMKSLDGDGVVLTESAHCALLALIGCQAI
jgi:hypothetical protein